MVPGICSADETMHSECARIITKGLLRTADSFSSKLIL
jgi:hypothetical protein